MTPLTSLMNIIIYLFILALIDHQVTGVLAKHLPPKGKFHSYVLLQTMLNQWVALRLAIDSYALTPDIWLAILTYITVTACWIGGWLDFIYFAAEGEIPPPEKKWHWMPFSPKTWQYAIWTLGWTIGVFSTWVIKINWSALPWA